MKVLDRTDSGGVLLKIDAADMPALRAMGQALLQLSAAEAEPVRREPDSAPVAVVAAYPKRAKKKAPGKPMACSECGKQFKPVGSAKTCSKKCSQARQQKHKNAWAARHYALKTANKLPAETRNPAAPFLDPEARLKIRERLIAQKVAEVGSRINE